MNRLFAVAAVGSLIALAVLFTASVRSEARTGASLAATNGIVDAGRFPTLQAALDALPVEGGLVQLPAGTFEISQPLVIRGDDVCLEGAGTATHIKNVNKEGEPAILIAHPDHKGAANDRDHELWRVRLANFRVTGQEQSGHGIVAGNVNEIFIDGVTVSYHGGDGILLNYCYEDPRVCDSLVTYNRGTGLNLQGCHDIVVSSNQFEENDDAVHCFNGFNLCMTGNCLDDHLGDGVVIENTYGSVLSGNMIEECNGTAIVLDRDCYGITLGANVIAHNGGGIDLRDAHGCAVSANTFTIMKSDALRIGPDSGRIAVSGNSFSSSHIGDGRDKRQPDDRTTAGLALIETSGVLVTGNAFSGVDSPAVKLQGSGRTPSMIVNNLLIDTEPGITTKPLSGPVTEENYSN